ncbi:SUMF1/EgtB/PvdO family nonheme iron enzyme [Candidatus Woesearchaeota archaeon]|nr:SUMF1/EgtB/PvdO family nonheme iron enzyme [Candidatus Woesearchaeota archaeon]
MGLTDLLRGTSAKIMIAAAALSLYACSDPVDTPVEDARVETVDAGSDSRDVGFGCYLRPSFTPLQQTEEVCPDDGCYFAETRNLDLPLMNNKIEICPDINCYFPNLLDDRRNIRTVDPNDVEQIIQESQVCSTEDVGFDRDMGHDADTNDVDLEDIRNDIDVLVDSDRRDGDVTPMCNEDEKDILFFDSDDDGYGVDGTGTFRCPEENYVTIGGDCNPSNSSIFPGAPEICDEVDNQCPGNGRIDEAIIGSCDTLNDNLNGEQALICDGEVRVPSTECVDPDECVLGNEIEQACGYDAFGGTNFDRGECREGIETLECVIDGDSVALYVSLGDCTAIMDRPEDLNGNDEFDINDIDALDNDCDTLPDNGPGDGMWSEVRNGDGDLLFYINKYEIPNAAYELCVNAGVCNAPTPTSSYSHPEYFGNPDFAAFPIVNNSSEDAITFCDYYGGAVLPSVDEWRYAGQGDDGTLYPWGNTPDPGCSFVNYNWCVGDTWSVFEAPENPFHDTNISVFGLYNMVGNASEWTRDFEDEAETRRVVMGGNFTDSLEFVNLTHEGRMDLDARSAVVTIRCLRYPVDEE